MRFQILAITAVITIASSASVAQDIIDPVTGGILRTGPSELQAAPPVGNQGIRTLSPSEVPNDYLPPVTSAKEAELPVADERADERLYPSDVTPPMRGAIMTVMTAYHGPIEVDLRGTEDVLYEDMRPFTFPAIAECERKYIGIFKRKTECSTIMGNAHEGVRVTRHGETCLIEEYAVNEVTEQQRDTKRDAILLSVNQYAREWSAPCPVHKQPTGLWARLSRSSK